MTRLHVLTAAALSWPLTAIYFYLPGKLDFPFFFTLLCLTAIYFMDAPKEDMTEKEFIQHMRDCAISHVKVTGSVTTDNLREYACSCAITAPTPQSWSKILKKPLFVRIDEVKSKIPSNDGRKIGVYVLAGEA